MRPAHILLAVLMTAVWGFNFVVIDIGLRTLPPFLLGCLRFVVAALPVCVVARPALPVGRLIAIGMTTFVGQYALLFAAMKAGVSPGLASILLQAQVVLTMLFAAFALRQFPRPHAVAGAGLAIVGLAVIALSIPQARIGAMSIALTLAASASWAAGNVLWRAAAGVDTFRLVVWLSLVPVLPFLAMSIAFEGGVAGVSHALAGIGKEGVIAVLYIGVLSTLVGFSLWGFLLRRYPTATVAPFTMLVPMFGLGFSWAVTGERFATAELAGAAVVLAGLALVVLPGRKAAPAWVVAPKSA